MTHQKSRVLRILNTTSLMLAACSLMLFNSTIAHAYTESSATKPAKEKPVHCGPSVPSNKRDLNNKEEAQIGSIIAEVESLESKGDYEQAANHYLDAQKIIMDAEGSCSVNSGRNMLIYGTKLYRAFRLEEAEEQIRKGLEVLQLHNVATKETCEETTGGILFLSEVYSMKRDNQSFADVVFRGWPFLKKCLESQGEVTKPALFDVFIRLGNHNFDGYIDDATETLRNERAELAFEALNKAYAVVDGKPTQMQLADILLKEGYFKYIMAGLEKNKKRANLLLRAKEATSQALLIHNKLNKAANADGSAKQLAYILESLGDYVQADNIYKDLIARALERPLMATNMEENYTLLSGYTAFTRDWGNGANFRLALLKLRQWEYVALKILLPPMTPNERIRYLNLFSASEHLAARGFTKGILNAEDYLDSFFQLRYSLIESELSALEMRRNAIFPPQPRDLIAVSSQMELLDISFVNQIKGSLKRNELFIQFVEASPESSNLLVSSSNEIEAKTQAFIIRNRADNRPPAAYKTCKRELCNKLISNAFKSSSEGLVDAPQKWRLLMDSLITSSLIEEIRGSELIYVGLDGFLQRVPIGIIRTYLESKGLRSLRVIPVQSLADIGHYKSTLQGGDSTAFYAPEFGEKTSCRSSKTCLRQWAKLAYSSKEGEAVSELISAHKLLGMRASKSSFLAIKSPKVLHISSHAGFTEESIGERLSGSSELGGRQVLDGLYNLYIVASGANLYPPDASIITYNDLASLDLSGTSLVVVSACETGLGGSQRGYGLFGMHRILSSVGADSTLLSMWKVDDEATSVLMIMFYNNLKEGYTVDESLAKAQDRMIEDPKLASRGWSHPYYWAGWQIAGKMTPVFKK